MTISKSKRRYTRRKVGGVVPPNYLDYPAALELVRELHVTTRRKWRQLVETNTLPITLPNHPDSYYQEWTNWKQWLGVICPECKNKATAISHGCLKD